MQRLTRAEMIRLLVELCGIPKPFLEKVDENTIQKLFAERLGGREQPLDKEA
ncbi:hypothetical protein HNR44_001086 [Geomicrobium halophilum]|uniref:Uncharacterized protein n=1 Tax=Geomicrobium halophilum TaxID=549000 RepID=A0A841PJU1_9BACL|nr:hypothetical protein [Geomicrobium halophilum]MBB6449137.1 hypothetical protein [Geomicrobium halophilum]